MPRRIPVALAAVAVLLVASCASSEAGGTDGTPTPSTSSAVASPSATGTELSGGVDEGSLEALLASGRASGNLCADSIDQADPAAGAFVVAEINSETALVSLTCAAGAYQSEVQVLLASPQGLFPLEVPTWSEAGEMTTVTTLAGFVDLNPSLPGITTLTLYRGLGDCGTTTSATLVDGQLVPTRIAHQRCDDDNPDPASAADPANWDVVFEDADTAEASASPSESSTDADA